MMGDEFVTQIAWLQSVRSALTDTCGAPINQSDAEVAAFSKAYRSCTKPMNSASEYCKPSASRSKTLSVGCLRPTSIKEI